MRHLPRRGFIVGTHGENISTVFDHPFTGPEHKLSTWNDFGLENVEPLELSVSLRKSLMKRLPHGMAEKATLRVRREVLCKDI